MKKVTIVKTLVGVVAVLALVVAYGVDNKIINLDSKEQTIANLKNIKAIKEDIVEQANQKKAVKTKKELSEKVNLLMYPTFSEKDKGKIKSIISSELGYFKYPITITESGVSTNFILKPDSIFTSTVGGVGKLSDNRYRLFLQYYINSKSVLGMLSPVRDLGIYSEVTIDEDGKMRIIEGKENDLEIGMGVAKSIVVQKYGDVGEIYSISSAKEKLEKQADGSYLFTSSYKNNPVMKFKLQKVEEGMHITRIQ